MFSSAGMFPAELSPAFGFFPNPFNLIDQPWFAHSLLIGLSFLSVLVIFGKEKKRPRKNFRTGSTHPPHLEHGPKNQRGLRHPHE